MNRVDGNEIAQDLQVRYSGRTRTVRIHGLSRAAGVSLRAQLRLHRC